MIIRKLRHLKPVQWCTEFSEDIVPYIDWERNIFRNFIFQRYCTKNTLFGVMRSVGNPLLSQLKELHLIQCDMVKEINVVCSRLFE